MFLFFNSVDFNNFSSIIIYPSKRRVKMLKKIINKIVQSLEIKQDEKKIDAYASVLRSFAEIQ